MSFNFTSDVSVNILSEIFGGVIYDLTGGGDGSDTTVVLQTVFRDFNCLLISFLLIIFAYILIAGTIHTSNDGTFLGRKWNSSWVPVRVVFGSVMVIPVKYGYCIAQLLTFYVILAGIAMATTLWQEVVGDIYDNYTPPTVSYTYQQTVDKALAQTLLSYDAYNLINSYFNDGSSYYYIDGKQGYTTFGEICNNPDYQSVFTEVGVCVKNDDGTYTYSTSGVDNYVSTLTNGGSLDEGDTFYLTLAEDTLNSSSESDIDQDWLNTWTDSGSNDTSKNLFLAQSAQLCNGVSDSDAVSACQTAFEYMLIDPESTDYDSSSGIQVSATNCDNGMCVPRTHYSDFVNSDNYNVDLTMATTPTQESDIYGVMYDYTSGSTSNDDDYTNEDYLEWKMKLGSVSVGGQDVEDQTFDCSDPSNCSMNNISQYVDPTVQNMLDGTCYDTDGTLSSACENTSLNINTYLTTGAWDIISAIEAEDTSSSTAQKTSSNDANSSGTSCNEDDPADGGWWCASSGYITLDQEMAESLNYLYNNIYKIIQNAASYGSATVGAGSIDVNYAVREFSSFADNDPSNGTSWSGKTSLDYSGYLNDYTNASDWDSLVADVKSDGAGLNGIDNLTTFLTNLSDDFKAPIQAIIWSHDSKYGTTVDQTLVDQLLNLFYTFENNGVTFEKTSGSSDDNVADMVPTREVLDQVFYGLLGNGDTSDADNVAESVNSVLEELYSLGTETDSSLDPTSPSYYIDEQFSLLDRTQMVGLDLITTTVDSFEQIYYHYEDEVNTVIKKAKNNSSNSVLKVMSEAFPFLGAYYEADIAQAEAQTTLDFAEIGMTLMWLPVTLFILVTLFVTGISFALILPLTPYILFWAGQVGWVLFCIEAIVAAPIVALGLVIPDGTDVFGQATPAVKMALNLILRPVLITIGLICGMILTYILITVSADGFHKISDAMLQLIPPGTSMTTAGILTCFLILMYATFLVMAFNKCFSLIYMIPDKVLHWVGAGIDPSGAAQDLQQLSGAVTQNAKEMGNSAGQGLQQGVSAQMDVGKAASSESYTQARTSQRATSSVTGAAWEGAALMI